MVTTPNAESGVPEIPDAASRIYAFARALGLTFDGLVNLLESYDLHIASGTAPRQIDSYSTTGAHPSAAGRSSSTTGDDRRGGPVADSYGAES